MHFQLANPKHVLVPSPFNYTYAQSAFLSLAEGKEKVLKELVVLLLVISMTVIL